MCARLMILLAAPLLAQTPVRLSPAPYDRLIQGLMERYSIPGAALAVTFEGRLLLSRAYGAGITPNSPFRIASLSKAITAVAVLRLVDANRIALDSPAFGLLPELIPSTGTDPRLRRITIRHLLHHQGGWDRAVSGDPTFRHPTAHAAIRAALARPLDFEPGSRAVYSNLGYAVLGRVIEKAAGTGYERAVHQWVLDPAGLPSPRVDPSLRRLDAHGGWLASAIDYTGFLNAIDGRGVQPLLSRASIGALTARPPHAAPGPAWYAMGLNIRPQGDDANWWHDGALDDTARTLAVRAHHGYSWAVFCNRMPPLESAFLADLDRGLWLALQQAAAGPSANRVH